MRTFDDKKVPKPNGNFDFIIDSKSPVAIEIGSGTGDFALQWAHSHPEKTLIAIEKTKEKYRKFINKYENAGKPANLYPVHGNAINFIVHFVPEYSVSHCFINYPNPYPKAQQANKRFHNMPFMDFLKTRLIPGGFLEFASNLSFTIDEAKQRFTQDWGFHLLDEKEILDPCQAQTAFEYKYLSRGESCTRMIFTN